MHNDSENLVLFGQLQPRKNSNVSRVKKCTYISCYSHSPKERRRVGSSLTIVLETSMFQSIFLETFETSVLELVWCCGQEICLVGTINFVYFLMAEYLNLILIDFPIS